MNKKRTAELDSNEKEHLPTKRFRFVQMYIHNNTLNCAILPCIPCLYKIYPKGLNNFPPNQRPEMCTRSNNQNTDDVGIYKNNGIKFILTVGDGDFSFSLSLSNAILKPSSDRMVIVTSYESENTVISTYTSSPSTIEQLKNLGAIVLFNVDATCLNSSTDLEKYKSKVDIVIWNFPCLRMENGADGQVDEIETNKELLRKFFLNIQEYLSQSDSFEAEVHITHKTIEPFCWWGIQDIAILCGLEYQCCMVFDKYLYPGYTNRKALDKKSFPLHDAVTYIFTKRCRSAEYVHQRMSSANCQLLSDSSVQKALEETITNVRSFRK